MLDAVQEVFFEFGAIRQRVGQGLHQACPERFDLDPEPPDQETAEDGTEVIARTADDHHDPNEEGETEGLVCGRCKLAVEGGHHGACQTADR